VDKYVIFGNDRLSNYILFEKTNPIFRTSKLLYPLLLKKVTSILQFCNSQKRTQNEPKTNPIEPNSKPIGYLQKMNVYPLLTKRYEVLQLFERNENKPNSNPIRTQTWAAWAIWAIYDYKNSVAKKGRL